VKLQNNILPENPLLFSFRMADAGRGFSPSTRVQLQQLGVHSVFVFSGHSLCMWPPPHHKLQGGCLQLAQTVVALRKASLSSVWFYLDDNMVQGIQPE
jgi:hypothetical protein